MVDNLADRPGITGPGKIQIRFGEDHEHSVQLSRAVSIKSKSWTGIVSLFCHRVSLFEVAVCGPNVEAHKLRATRISPSGERSGASA